MTYIQKAIVAWMTEVNGHGEEKANECAEKA